MITNMDVFDGISRDNPPPQTQGKTADIQPEQMVRPCPELIEALRTVTDVADVISGAQLLTALISYIREKRLYDPENVKHVYCGGDRLGEVLGIAEFTRDNIKSILMKYVTVESENWTNQPVTDLTDTKIELSPKVHYTLQQTTIPQGSLRSSNQDCHQTGSRVKEEADLPKKRRHTSSSSSDKELSTLPWYFGIQRKSSSGSVNSNDVFTVNSEDHAVIAESADDLWFLDEDSFAVEFEVITDDSDNDSDVASSSSSSSPNEDVQLNPGELMMFMSENDSSSMSSTDSEISHLDKWACVECSYKNSPKRRYCCVCWTLRKGWLSRQVDSSGKPPKRPFRRSLSDPCPSTGATSPLDAGQFGPGAVQGCPIAMALAGQNSTAPSRSNGTGVSRPGGYQGGDSDEVHAARLTSGVTPTGLSVALQQAVFQGGPTSAMTGHNSNAPSPPPNGTGVATTGTYQGGDSDEVQTARSTRADTSAVTPTGRRAFRGGPTASGPNSNGTGVATTAGAFQGGDSDEAGRLTRTDTSTVTPRTDTSTVTPPGVSAAPLPDPGPNTTDTNEIPAACLTRTDTSIVTPPKQTPPDPDPPSRLLTLETGSSGYHSSYGDALRPPSAPLLLSAPTSGRSSPQPALSQTDSSAPGTPIRSTPSRSLVEDNSAQDQSCIICMSAPKNGCMVHMTDGIGHILCCYKCARKLEKNGKACPVCRQTDYIVIKTFTY